MKTGCKSEEKVNWKVNFTYLIKYMYDFKNILKLTVSLYNKYCLKVFNNKLKMQFSSQHTEPNTCHTWEGQQFELVILYWVKYIQAQEHPQLISTDLCTTTEYR